MSAIGQLLLFLLNAYFYVIVIEVVVSWLLVFEVINLRNPQAQNLIRLLRRLTDPVMGPIRKYVPAIGGIDISPIIVIFGIFMLQNLVARVFFASPF
ncbi:MAG: YggT family protein [Rhodospirillales bacterium]|nr:YggT family protein [Rhodospirillales bacterium]